MTIVHQDLWLGKCQLSLDLIEEENVAKESSVPSAEAMLQNYSLTLP